MSQLHIKGSGYGHWVQVSSIRFCTRAFLGTWCTRRSWVLCVWFWAKVSPFLYAWKTVERIISKGLSWKALGGKFCFPHDNLDSVLLPYLVAQHCEWPWSTKESRAVGRFHDGSYQVRRVGFRELDFGINGVACSYSLPFECLIEPRSAERSHVVQQTLVSLKWRG